MKCFRWETLLSNCKGLNFKRLVDQGYFLLFEVEDENNQLFEIVLNTDVDYAYLLVNSEVHDRYKVDLKETGWTYIVEGAPFVDTSNMWEYVKSHLHQDLEPYAHYVISTYDSCLEILSTSPPVVRKVS